MDVRLVAIDIDGTLIDSRGRIPEANIIAVRAALDAGVHVVLVTGRSFPFARAVVEVLPDTVTLIASNGAIERTLDGHTVARRLLARETARQVLEHTRAFRHTSALLFDREAEGHVVAESMDWDHPHRRGYWEGRRHWIGQASPLEDALTEDPIQVMFNGDVETMRAIHASLAGLGPMAVCRTEYERRDFALVDVTATTANKGHALAARAAAARDRTGAGDGDRRQPQRRRDAGVRGRAGDHGQRCRRAGRPRLAPDRHPRRRRRRPGDLASGAEQRRRAGGRTLPRSGDRPVNR